MTEDATPLEWSQPFGSGSGRWSADTRVDGLDIEVTVNGIHPGPHCPCAPGDCEYPGMPYVNVYALSWVPMTEPAASGRHYLTSPEQSVHVAEPLATPDTLTGIVALKLAITAAGSGRTALRDLARHAARLDIASERRELNGG
jgi:hypothetical protein